MVRLGTASKFNPPLPHWQPTRGPALSDVVRLYVFVEFLRDPEYQARLLTTNAFFHKTDPVSLCEKTVAWIVLTIFGYYDIT